MLSTLKVSALSLVSALVLITACTPDKDAGANGRQKLKSYTEDITAVGIGHVVETFDVNYDGQDRITSIVSTTKPGHRLEYNYINNDKFTYEQIEDNKVQLHCDYFIDGEIGKVDSLYQYNIRKDTITFKYIYNSENKLIKELEYLPNSFMAPVLANTMNYVYDGKGTLTKKVESFGETSYRYDAEYKNTTLITPGYIPVQDLLPSHTYITRHNRTTTIEHTYTYDDKGRLASERAASSPDGRITIRTYTYQ
jgi:YD repeat-containing protein